MADPHSIADRHARAAGILARTYLKIDTRLPGILSAIRTGDAALAQVRATAQAHDARYALWVDAKARTVR